MSSRYKQKVPVFYEESDRFNLEPVFSEPGKEQLEQQFALLKEALLENLIEETQTLALRKRFEQAAGEAAGIAWTTEFPLLVFPALFEEFTSSARKRESRQQRIKARSEMLLAETV